MRFEAYERVTSSASATTETEKTIKTLWGLGVRGWITETIAVTAAVHLGPTSPGSRFQVGSLLALTGLY